MTPAKEHVRRTAAAGIALSAIQLLAACASSRHEAPPDVAAQPPRITTAQARDSGRGPDRSPRYTPSDLSVEQIRAQHRDAPAPLDFGERVDHAHDRLYTWVQESVEATDHRFAARDQELKPVPAAPFRVGLVVESVDRSDGLDISLDADLDVALRLPNIEDRLRVFVTSNELDEAPRDARAETSLRAGLRYEVIRQVDFDLGVKLDLPPVAFASLRWSRQYPLGSWDFYPMAKLFADSDEGVGYVGATTFDRWSGRHLFRSTSFVKWRSDRDRLEWTQTLIYARANQLIVPDRYGSYLRARDIGNGWGLRLLASGGREMDNSDVDYYEAGVFYRRPVANRWLYWFVEPLVRWDKKYDWGADPGIRIGIDALFWDLARPAAR